MSKERARRRAVREHESALRTAARAAEQERRERRQARLRSVRRRTTDRLPTLSPAGRPTGILARRRRARTTAVIVVLLAVNAAVWLVRPDWAARLGALVVSLLLAPVVVAAASSRR